MEDFFFFDVGAQLSTTHLREAVFFLSFNFKGMRLSEK